VPVKPLNASSLKALLERVEYARDGEIRFLTPHSPASITICFSVQDSARGYDWIDVAFRMEGVSDAKLVSDNILQTLDMGEGITAEITADGCAIAIGSYNGRVSDAPFYIIGTTLAYEELPFSG
jgi:hypothetical protein